MARLTLELREDDPAGLEAEVRSRLYEFNAAATGIDDGRLLVLSVRDDDDALVAGLFGWTWGGCAYIDLLWVDEAWRGRGLGSRLLAASEAEARARGCHQILLSTHTFQAPGFYRGRGFEECGAYDGYPQGHRQVHLAKRLNPPD